VSGYDLIRFHPNLSGMTPSYLANCSFRFALNVTLTLLQLLFANVP